MSKFSNLKSVKSVDKFTTTVFEFDMLEPVGEDETFPWVEVRPTSEINAAYTNAVLGSQARGVRKLGKNRKLTVKDLRENRETDIELFPKHIIVTWGGWQDKDGKEIEFSEDECRDLLRQLPIDLFDELRAFCGEISNFR